MADHRYWLGPLGGLRSLPDVYSDVPAALARVGGVSTSLGGNSTVDTLGYTRSWSWDWDTLTAGQAAYVQAVQAGIVPTPLRLLDPRLVNRLPIQVASGGSQRRIPDGFDWSSGAVSWHQLTELTDPTTLAPAPMLAGALYWLLPAGGGRLYPSAATPDGTWRAPIVPTDQAGVELSVWLAGISALDLQVRWREYTAAQLAARTGFTEYAGPGFTALPGRWQRAAVTVIPAPATVAVSMAVTAGASSPPGWMSATAWQVAPLDRDPLPPATWAALDAAVIPGADWWPGGGAPRVAVDTSGFGHGLPGLHRAALTVTQTG